MAERKRLASESDNHERQRRPHRRPHSMGNKRAQLFEVRVEGAKIVEHLAKGVPFATACRAAGISAKAGWLWRRLGRLEVGEREGSAIAGPEHIWFENAVQETLAAFEMRIVGYWVEAAEHNWQAARDLLARRFPRRWGNLENRGIHLRNKGPMEIQLVWGDEDAPVWLADPDQKTTVLPPTEPPGAL